MVCQGSSPLFRPSYVKCEVPALWSMTTASANRSGTLGKMGKVTDVVPAYARSLFPPLQ
jgi:hypothetical protein